MLDILYRTFAIIGSVILIICIFPQIFKIYKNKSAKDVSNKWICLTLLGLIFISIYASHFKLFEILIPIIIQIILFISLFFMKKYYDRFQLLQSQSVISSSNI